MLEHIKDNSIEKIQNLYFIVGDTITRNRDIFKKYADESVMAMNKFLGELNET